MSDPRVTTRNYTHRRHKMELIHSFIHSHADKATAPEATQAHTRDMRHSACRCVRVECGRSLFFRARGNEAYRRVQRSASTAPIEPHTPRTCTLILRGGPPFVLGRGLTGIPVRLCSRLLQICGSCVAQRDFAAFPSSSPCPPVDVMSLAGLPPFLLCGAREPCGRRDVRVTGTLRGLLRVSPLLSLRLFPSVSLLVSVFFLPEKGDWQPQLPPRVVLNRRLAFA